LVGQTGEALDGIVLKVGEIDALVSELASSASEQARGLNEVNTAVNQMDQGAQRNAALISRSAGDSRNLVTAADELSGMVARFRTSQAAPSSLRRAG
jgi:methyl-accepting chemotaxis protein